MNRQEKRNKKQKKKKSFNSLSAQYILYSVCTANKRHYIILSLEYYCFFNFKEKKKQSLNLKPAKFRISKAPNNHYILQSNIHNWRGRKGYQVCGLDVLSIRMDLYGPWAVKGMFGFLQIQFLIFQIHIIKWIPWISIWWVYF